MAAYKKKNIASLALAMVVLTSSALVVPAFAEMTPLRKQGAAQSTPAGSLFANDPNLSVGSADSLDTRELFLKMMLSVLLVVALGVAAIYISKKFGARITNLPGKKIRIIETVHLGPRKTVHLLKIGNQQILIGSTTESITKLADIGLTAENAESAEKSIINNR